MRDTTEALQIFESLPPDLQKKSLTFLRLLKEGDAEKIRLFCEQEGIEPPNIENPA